MGVFSLCVRALCAVPFIFVSVQIEMYTQQTIKYAVQLAANRFDAAAFLTMIFSQLSVQIVSQQIIELKI